MIKSKKYRVILDFWKALESSTSETVQYYRDEYSEEISEETAEQIASDVLYDYVVETLIPEIDRHAPHGIAVFANLGLWNGRRRGLKIVDSFRDVLSMCDVMYITIETTPQGIKVTAPHHDGINIYTLRALTEAGASRYLDELEESLFHGSPRTVRRYTRRIGGLFE